MVTKQVILTRFAGSSLTLRPLHYKIQEFMALLEIESQSAAEHGSWKV